MTKKHTTPQARRDAEATLRAMATELDVDFLEVTLTHDYPRGTGLWFVLWYDGVASGDTLDDAFIKALHKKAGTEPPPKEWG